MRSYSKILNQAYQKFLLPLGTKRVSTPYRRNEFGQFQKVGAAFQGKSSPEVLLKTTKRLARTQNFDLEKASVAQIKEFMRKNKLGIDCSGFVYRMLNYLLEGLEKGSLEALGMEHVGRTNVEKFTSNKFTLPIKSSKNAKPGDLIKLNSGEDVPHCLVILEKKDEVITYAHSSGLTKPDGVHLGKIIKGKFPKELQIFSYNEGRGDGIRRLRILS